MCGVYVCVVCVWCVCVCGVYVVCVCVVCMCVFCVCVCGVYVCCVCGVCVWCVCGVCICVCVVCVCVGVCVCKRVLYYSHRVATQLQLTNTSYRIMLYGGRLWTCLCIRNVARAWILDVISGKFNVVYQGAVLKL